MVEASLPAALADGDPIVQREAIALAVRTKDAVHAGALAKLARVRDEKVALAAVDGIVELRGYNGAYELAAIAADPDVLESVWRRAALAARSFGARSLDAFVLGIEKARDERRDAMAAMLATGLDDLELRLIVDMFADASSSRSTVARLVADRCGERAQATAFARLPSAPPTLRRVLIAYLRERSGAAFTSRLVARAGSGAQAERLAAIDLLGEAGDERGLNGLAGMLSDPSPEVRARVAVVVSRAADREVAKLLVARAGDEAPVVRAGVMRGLGRYIPGDPVATKTAKRALADPDESVRIAAIHALSGPRDAAVVRAFKARLFDSSTSERAAIAQALGKSTLPEAVVMLVDLATDSNAVVREHAVAALGGGR
jgi:hypothetical protein